jgi:RHS repeat-associated protein
VQILEGTNILGVAQLINGTATFATSTLGIGAHNLTGTYVGDSSNMPSISGGVSVNISVFGGGANQQWSYGYDAMGRPTIKVDPNGNTTNTYYDSLGRPIQIQEPANTGTAAPTVTSMEFNAADSLTKVTDPRNIATTYTPDGLGQVKTLASPDSGTAGYTYDANGNLLTKTDARGKLTTYTYDALNRLKSITYTSGTPSTLEYDGGASPYPAAAGELTKVTDASGSITYAYDSAGRLTTKTQVTAGKTFVVAYTWGDTGSALDKITAITYPSGSRVNYSYDQYGSVSAITTNPVNPNGVGTSGTLLPLLSGITTNVDNNISGWSWASGKTQAIGYDSFGQVSGYNLGDPNGVGIAAGVRRTILRDASGRITGYTHTNNGASQSSLDQSFGYDNLNRLLNANMGTSTIGYSYDATGNRTSKVISGTAYTNTVSPTSNRYTQVQDVGGTAAIQTDAAGNITNDGVNTFTYGDRGRLGSVTTAGGAVAYSYNAQELRVAKSGPSALVPTGAAYYVYDEAGKLLGEYDANANPLYETVYLGAMPVGLMKQTGSAGANTLATNLYNVYADHLGAPRIVTRASDAAIVWRWDSAESFGGTAPNQNPSNLGAFVYSQRLPGQVFDQETGLFQNWNREYNPRIGRYMQSDPIGLAGGINTYGYVAGNPLSGIDPRGLATFTLTGGGSAVVVGGGEGSFGVYISNKPNDIGFVISGGAGGGANVGLSAQLGYVPGPLSNVSGNTKNTNLSCGVGSGTWMADPKTGDFAGLTVGPAGRLGASETNAQTETWGLRGLLDRLFDRIGRIK